MLEFVSVDGGAQHLAGLLSGQSFIQSKKLPPELMEEVRAHFHAQGARGESINMTWLFSVLSYGLQVRIRPVNVVCTQ